MSKEQQQVKKKSQKTANQTKGMGITAKMILFFGILIALICLAISSVSSIATKKIMVSQEKASIQEKSVLLADVVERKLDSNLTELETMARRSEFNNPEVTVMQRSELCDSESDNSDFYTLLYVLPNGDAILPSNGITLNLFDTHDDAFQKALESKESCYKSSVTNNQNTLMVTSAVPILDGSGNVSGVLVGTVLISEFGNCLGDDIEAFIVTADGDYIGHTKAAPFAMDGEDYIPNEDGTLQTEGEGVNISINPLKYAETDPSYQPIADLITKMIEGEQGVLDYTSMDTGNAQMVAYATVPATNWKVAYLVDEDVVLKGVAQQTRTSAIVALVSVIVGIVLTLVLSKIMLRSLSAATKDLGKIVDDIKRGEGDLTARIPVRSKDEIGQIVEGINSYTEVLQAVTLKIKDGSIHLETSVDGVTKAVVSANEQATDTSAIMEELAASMEEVSATVTNIGEMMEQMRDNVVEIAGEADHGLNFSNEISSKAENLKESSLNSQSKTKEMIQQITNVLNESIKNSKQVEQIDALTDDILSISSQTNLLALNASIEAARAGEAGKGFAVVAEEIRLLADNSRQTANSIQEISKIVNIAVAELAENANEMLQYVNDDMMQDYDSMVTTGESYAMDADKVREIMTTMQQTLEVMRENISDITQNVSDTIETVQQSAEGVGNVAMNTTELVQSMAEITNSVDDNKNVAENLMTEVERFKKM